jgi:hypothetical protein
MDKPMRTRVMDYIDKQIAESNTEAVSQEPVDTPKKVS